MTNSWIDNSETVSGLILQNRISLNSVRPEIFFGEYRNLIKYMKEGIIEPEELIEKCGLGVVKASLDAAKSLNGLGDADWVRILEHSASDYTVGVQLEKVGRELQQGKKIDYSRLKSTLQNMDNGTGNDLVPLSKVQSGVVPFVKIGWPPLDNHFGGIPEVGLITVGGNPGVGKTTWMIKVACRFVKSHPDKCALLFSLEMILQEVAGRIREIEPNLTKEEEERIILCETPITPEEGINKAATVDNLGLMITDFADLMIRGENSESAMAHIYRTYMLGAKQLYVPNILLSQLSRAYKGGIPRPNHIRYTSLAEALSWMLIMLYNPSIDYFAEEDEATDALPILDNVGYMIGWKVRGGFRQHLDDSPGAVAIPFLGSKGWGDKSRWYSLRKYS